MAVVGPKIDQYSIEWKYIWDTISVGTINNGCASRSLGPKINHHQNEWGLHSDTIPMGIVNSGCVGGCSGLKNRSIAYWMGVHLGCYTRGNHIWWLCWVVGHLGPKNRSILYTSGYTWDIVSVGIVNGGCAGGHGDQK